MKNNLMDYKKYKRLRNISFGTSVVALALGLGLNSVLSNKAEDILNRNEQKYLDFKSSVEFVEKQNELIGQIEDSSVDMSVKDVLKDIIVNGNEYAKEKYEDSLTSEDREEIKSNEKKSDVCSSVSGVIELYAGVATAVGAVAAVCCHELMSYNKDEQEMAD